MKSDFLRELAHLESAEDFLDYFGIDYASAIVAVNRLHILKRFHDYLEGHRQRVGEPGRDDCRRLLERAYQDFVHSNAYIEKVMRVHQRAAGIAHISLAALNCPN